MDQTPEGEGGEPPGVQAEQLTGKLPCCEAVPHQTFFPAISFEDLLWLPVCAAPA